MSEALNNSFNLISYTFDLVLVQFYSVKCEIKVIYYV